MSHNQFIGNIGSFNTNNNNTIFVTELDDERHQMLQWLSPLDPSRPHRDVRGNRVDGVGDWVLKTSEFMKWRHAEDGCVEPVLLCYGNPGVGKTYIRWKGTLLERDDADFVDDQEIIVP